jgi:hypothetical protein
MPHFGELAAILGTLRRDGVTTRTDNALRTADTEEWLWESGAVIAFEDATDMVTE